MRHIRLFEIVEVPFEQRIRCQAPGCGRTVHKRIHVVIDNDLVLALGSDCWARLYAGRPDVDVHAQLGSVQSGRKLTAEERALLISNTREFVAAQAQRVEAERRAREATDRAKSDQQARRSQFLAPNNSPPSVVEGVDDDAPWQVSDAPPGRRHGVVAVPSYTQPRNDLERYRQQQLANGVRYALVRHPDLASIPHERLERAVVEAKQEFLSRGGKLGSDGASADIADLARDRLVER